MATPEQRAREAIDAKLAESGWVVQSRDVVNLAAAPGVIVRGFALEAKPQDHTLRGVEVQTDKYTRWAVQPVGVMRGLSEGLEGGKTCR